MTANAHLAALHMYASARELWRTAAGGRRVSLLDTALARTLQSIFLRHDAKALTTTNEAGQLAVTGNGVSGMPTATSLACGRKMAQEGQEQSWPIEHH